MLYGRGEQPISICPARLTERRQVFVDCLHLLTSHEPGNELHIVREVSVPGGSVDYLLVSARAGRVRDFAGIELQALDTTGTVWPERPRLLRELGVHRSDDAETSTKLYGMNWKMSAKTILVQIHHKVETFERLGKKLVLATQDKLFEYMAREFDFQHLSNPARLGDAMHLHAYALEPLANDSLRLSLEARSSTDAAGIARCLGLKAEARMELDAIVRTIERKISTATLFAAV